MNRIERLYALAEELRAAGPRGRSSGWLAERFEVSSRTIKRDMAALAQSGLAVWAEEGRGGGYRLAPGASLPPLSLTAGEATAIALALAASPDAPFAADGRAALTKIVRAMPAAQRASAADLASRIWMRTPSRAGGGATRRLLDESLRDDTVVLIDYTPAEGEPTPRRPVEPLAFARTGGNWYLLAWCRLREDGRWFRLDRVRRAVRTHERFAPRDVPGIFGQPPPDAAPLEFGGLEAISMNSS